MHNNALVAFNYRWCAYAEQSEPNVTPGATFNYATLDTSVIGCLLAASTGTNLADFGSEILWKPAGMEHPGYWIMDGP